MNIRKIAHGGLAAFTLIGTLVASGPSAAQGPINVAGNLQQIVSGSTPYPIFHTVATTVHSPRELINLLTSDFRGRVIIPHTAGWDLSGLENIPVRSGVSLIGERGPLGSRPLLYTTSKDKEYGLFSIDGNDVRVEGIHFRGPANFSRESSQPKVYAIRVVQYPDPDPNNESGRNIVIADNELDQWTGAAVEVFSLKPGLKPGDAGRVRVERNYIHENARDGMGYGVAVGIDGYATIEGNVFDFNRHAVTASGSSGGYIARFNYVLQGGHKDGNSYGSHFDVHGSMDPGSWNGGRAGEYFEIAHNTIRGEQTWDGFEPFTSADTRDAITLRGRPSLGATFRDNVLVHDNAGKAISLKGGRDNSLHPLAPGTFNFTEVNNRYDTDFSTEFATGDFDGDRRTDIFVANGTAWFFSRAGSQPWQFLQASPRRVHELGFADIDNDGVTDVLYRDGNTSLGYFKSGTAGLVNFTTSPVPMKELRFGDFDGDKKTDIFSTQGGKWIIRYGSTGAWTPVGGSSQPLSELLFGEFDDVPGTDVAGRNNGKWAYSSGALSPWTQLNSSLGNSLAGAVAVDFDGNGKSDIAWSEGQTWYVSWNGRSARTVLRNGAGHPPYPGLKGVLLGQFEGGPRTQAVTLNLVRILDFYRPGERFVIWDGRDVNGDFQELAWQNMR